MKTLSIILASAVLVGTITNADAMGRRGDPEFNTFMVKMADSNGDGKISKEEWMKMSVSMAEKEFATFDVDDDGHVSKLEFFSGQR